MPSIRRLYRVESPAKFYGLRFLDFQKKREGLLIQIDIVFQGAVEDAVQYG